SKIHVVPAQLVGPIYGTKPFSERQDVLLAASWLPGADSPNGDGLTWFVRHVLPHLRRELPSVQLRVTGANPPPEILTLAGPNVQFEGRVNDLRALYDRSRVAIAPSRYGAGVKLKTVESLQFGVPIVATSVGAEGIDTRGTGALVITDDPE